ncbi:MAG: hypothetical protein H6737_18330 [Alphaproteobacteria bacterium]|nr:hypothetical protein [Alphaproteobacteria bacterium]
MFRLFTIPVAIAALVACSGDGGLIGDDVGALHDDEHFELDPTAPTPGTEADELVIQDDVAAGYQGNFAGACLPDDAVVPDPPMVAVGAVGEIEVLHQGVETGVDPMWYIHGTLDEDTRTISIVYEETNPDPSSETCLWSMLYLIKGVPPGEWTVEARGDTSTTTVF